MRGRKGGYTWKQNTPRMQKGKTFIDLVVIVVIRGGSGGLRFIYEVWHASPETASLDLAPDLRTLS